MSARAQKIAPEFECRIRESIKIKQEIRTQLLLDIQALSALLPESQKTKTDDPGFITNPMNGKKIWYDQKAKTRYEKSNRPLKVVGEK